MKEMQLRDQEVKGFKCIFGSCEINGFKVDLNFQIPGLIYIITALIF